MLGSCSHERLGSPFLNQVSILIENFSVPGDDASPSVGLGLQRHDGGEGVDRITENDWPMKLPFEDGQKREGVDARCLAHQAGGDGQTEQPMSHGPAEGIASARKNDRHAADYNLPTDRRRERHPFPSRSVVGFPTRHRRQDHRMTRLTTNGASRPAISSVMISFGDERPRFVRPSPESKPSRAHSDFRREVVKIIRQCGLP